MTTHPLDSFRPRGSSKVRGGPGKVRSPQDRESLLLPLITAALLMLLLAALVLPLFFPARAAAASRPAAAPAGVALPATPVRDVRTLPSLSRFGRVGAALDAPTVTPTDTFLTLSHGFQELNGACAPRGWAGEDLTTRIYAHVSDQYVVNRAFAGARGGAQLDVATAPITGTALGQAGEIALNDSGRVVFFDVCCIPPSGQTAYEVYPEQNLLRRFTSDPADAYRPREVASDPSTGGIFIANGPASLVYFLAPGAANATVFADRQSSIGSGADTTLEFAEVDPASMSVSNAGDIYYSETFGLARLRMIRRNDLRVISLGGINNVSLVTVNPDGSELFYTTYLDSSLHRLDLATLASTPVAGPHPAIANATELVWSNGTLYLAAFAPSGDNRPARVYRIAGNALVPVAGANSYYGPAATASSGLQTSLADIGGMCADGAGGVYFTSGQLVLRLRADGNLESVAGDLLSVNMGQRALRVGADMTTAPDEVANWLSPSGYGNGWSQRVVSPPVDFALHPGAVLSFDLASELAVSGTLDLIDAFGFSFLAEFVAVQVEAADGGWINLSQEVTVPVAGITSLLIHPLPRGVFKVRVPLAGQNLTRVVSPARFRIVVQTSMSSSNEDSPPVAGGGGGAAILDNIAFRDGLTNLLPFEDFEDGDAGVWTFAALNGAYDDATLPGPFVRDVPPPGTLAELRPDFDFSDPSCVWTFTSVGDSVPAGLHARITSPWIARNDPAAPLLFAFSGKLNTTSQGRVLNFRVRGKNEGDSRPTSCFFPAFLLNSGTAGGDLNSPFIAGQTLSFPDDFSRSLLGGGFDCDSIQIVLGVEDRREQLLGVNPQAVATRLPYLDDIRVLEVGVDDDFDGIADAHDQCPTECAAGQDADGDGCVDATATFHHVETWPAGRAITYAYAAGSNAIVPGAFAALDSAFAAWTSVAGADVPLQKLLPAEIRSGDPFDGVNLISFTDEQFPFSPDVLAVTATLEITRRTAYGDQVVTPGTIVDKDILFNPDASFATPEQAGAFDLRSVATHEIGHLLGLDHSGVRDATMFFVQLPGDLGASLSPDDESAIAAAYPGPALATDFATLRGVVLRDTTGLPVGGALVTAVRLDADSAAVDTVASDYTDELGRFALFRVPAGRYGIHAQALDGSVLEGMNAGVVSARVASVTGIPFEPEWYSADETAFDDRSRIQPLEVAAGALVAGLQIVTNLDTIPPGVLTVSPGPAATGIGIDVSVQVTFSDPIDASTLNAGFGVYSSAAPSQRLAGSALVADRGRRLVFSPGEPLAFSTEYTLRLTSAITDEGGNPLPAEFTSTFTTQDQPPVSISNIQPRQVAAGALVTITGTGFDPSSPLDNNVVFEQSLPVAGFVDTVTGTFVTPTTMVVRVPPTRPPGVDTVWAWVGTAFNRSNNFGLTILPPPQQPSPSPSGSPVAVGFAPTDVALAPDGSMAYVVGDGGFVTVNLSSPGGGPIRQAVPRDPRAARAIALSPDGSRAFVSYPGDSAVVVYDSAPSSAALGTALATVPLVGRPGPLAMAPTGWRLYAGDAANGIIHEVDTRPGSLSENTQVRTIPFGPGAVQGLAVSYDNLRLTVASPTSLHYVWLDGRPISPQGSGTMAGGVSASPTGALDISAAGSGGVLSPDSSPEFVGGFVRDVVFTPQGQAAYLVNQALNRVQVFNVTFGTPGYRSVVADAGAGSSPVAAAVDGGGGLLAVANRGSQDLSLYVVTQTGAPALVRVVPDVAIAGDLVGAQGAPGSSFDAPTRVDLGTGAPFVAENAAGRGAGFRVPPLTPRETQLVLEQPTGLRSLSLPFRVVDPITSFEPTSQFLIPGEDTACAQSGDLSIVGALTQLRVSPDGRVLAVVRENRCAHQLDFYTLVSDGTLPFGAHIGTGILNTGAELENVFDAAFTPDGNRLWTVSSQLGVRIADSDPANPNFGNVATVIGTGVVPTARAVIADPLGRWMLTGSPFSVTYGLLFWDWEADTVAFQVPDVAPYSLAATGDGRTLVAGLQSQAAFVDLGTRTVLALSPSHGPVAGPGAPDSVFFSVAVTGDGRRAMGVYTGAPRRVAVWNLDPGAGPIGQELYFGVPEGMPDAQPGRLVAGPDGHSVVTYSETTNLMLSFDLSVIPPVVTAQPGGFPTLARTAIQRSPDGRQLWVTVSPTFELTNTAEVHMFELVRGQALVPMSGEGQSGLGGSTLPVPVRVRVTGPGGAPVQGLLVRFELLGDNGRLPSGGVIEWHTSDVNGEAGVAWTLPATPGTVQMHIAASAGSGPPLSRIITAEVVADDADVLPAVVALSPPTGATGLNSQTPVGVRFNQRMTPGVTQTIQLFANGQPVAGAYELVDQSRFVLFRPAAPLPFSASCSLAVAPGALDTDGQAVATGASATFMIEAPPAVLVDAIVPPAGPPGAAVTLSGKGFSALATQNTVIFNGTLGAVRTASTTGLTADVPVVATSGPVTVTANNQTSPGVNFIVLPPNADPGGVIGDIPAGQGSRDIALTPDGGRAYVTNPPLNTVTVLDLVAVETITAITVGLRPLAVAMLASPLRMYVANHLSNSVSVVDADPQSPDYHHVVQTIPVGQGPVDVTVWPAGRKVYVLNADSETISEIDANPGNATFDQVTKINNCGSGAVQVVISADGSTAYVATAAGLEIINLATDEVTVRVNCGSAAQQVVITADGSLAFVLTASGELVVIALSGPNANQVVARTNCGSGAQQVVITADGSLAYVTTSDGEVLVFEIGAGAGGNGSSRLPGTPVTLTRIETFDLGGAPAGVAVDPLGRSRVWVTNSETGRLHALGTPDALPRVKVDFQFHPGTINARSMGRWVKGTIEPPAPFLAESLVVSTIRLGGVVHAEPDQAVLGDHDQDGVPDLRVRFSRHAVHLLLPAGDDVPVCVEGRLGSRLFHGCDTIRVHHGVVKKPLPGDVVPPLAPYVIEWDAGDDDIEWVSVLYSLDHGANWTQIAERQLNVGAYTWHVPAIHADSVRVALVFVKEEFVPQEEVDPDYPPEEDVIGVFAMSGPFSIFGATAVEAAPAELSFSIAGPNPARGAARLRFGLPRAADVRLELFDVAGRRVRMLAKGRHEPGWHEVTWNGAAENGARIGAGLYFVRFRAEGREFGQRLIWLR